MLDVVLPNPHDNHLEEIFLSFNFSGEENEAKREENVPRVTQLPGAESRFAGGLRLASAYGMPSLLDHGAGIPKTTLAALILSEKGEQQKCSTKSREPRSMCGDCQDKGDLWGSRQGSRWLGSLLWDWLSCDGPS